MIYLRNNSYAGDSPIVCGTVPDTMDLIHQAQELLANT
jgi:hypothetical protein